MVALEFEAIESFPDKRNYQENKLFLCEKMYVCADLNGFNPGTKTLEGEDNQLKHYATLPL